MTIFFHKGQNKTVSGIPAEYLFLKWGYTLIKRLSEGGCAEEL